MVRGKKGSKLAKHRRLLFKKDRSGNLIWDPFEQKYLTEIVLGDHIDGCFRGTRNVPPGNAVKHPITKGLQTAELLVQMGLGIASLPASEAEMYWQSGNVRPGNRFVPDKPSKVKPPADPQQDAPKT